LKRGVSSSASSSSFARNQGVFSSAINFPPYYS
jgi:hypothetical protein